MTLTQADREAAATMRGWYSWSSMMATNDMTEFQHCDATAIAFAAYRLEIIEQCAAIALKREAMHEEAWPKAPNMESGINLDARKWEAHDIASAIRALAVAK